MNGNKPKSGLHSRNKMRYGYNFTQLVKATPELKAHLIKTPKGENSIDFSNPKSVICLNKALLADIYKIKKWEIPPNYLCPPVPGRADLLHHLADLISLNNPSSSGSLIKVLDIGTGASAIYPLIGYREFGWSFVGAEIDKKAVQSVKKILDKNHLNSAIEVRHQKNANHFFKGIICKSEYFELTLCNPPFYTSAKAAQSANHRKNKNLGKKNKQRNFGGQSHELWCPGGELAFIRSMILESKEYSKQVKWFSSLVSNKAHIKPLKVILKNVNVSEVKVLPMAQGQKVSRILAWKF